MNAAVDDLEFHLTGEMACPYLPGQRQRLIWTGIPDDALPAYAALTDFGFRRSGAFLYASICRSCTACIPVRIRVGDFVHTRRQRRIVRRNRGLRRIIGRPAVRDGDWRLFASYVAARHPGGLMDAMTRDDYRRMLEDAPEPCRMIRYVDMRAGGGGRIRSIALTDILPDGLSMCYSCFAPEAQCHSPGIHMILDHVALARDLDLDYVYLGYWIRDCARMSYKSEFTALEYNRDGEWHRGPEDTGGDGPPDGSVPDAGP